MPPQAAAHGWGAHGYVGRDRPHGKGAHHGHRWDRTSSPARRHGRHQPAVRTRLIRRSQPGLRLLLLADTHVPKRARALPDEVWAQVEAADLVVHAGDWVDVAFLDRLEERSRALLACYGNNDGPPLRERLPLVGRRDVAGVRFAVVHETGDAKGRERRCDEEYADVDVLVFGHSHIPWDTTTPGGIRLLNPGSPTDRRRQPHCTYMTVEVVDGRLGDVRLHRLPPRVPARSRRAAGPRS